ncbi:rod shape-determining protein MreC [Saonia flava]|uniref:Cell shape-determining protein MreC n=1 Tax=Saonia flava TaxID=523696 RepID=A0A846QXH4_9FLAO|nr:rod shape-determining protein MreC [Saonia flava]NJB71907.1 rod shape-determining protein MreC [Saonia flava]
MQQIINFIIRYKITLLYIFLMSIALGFTIQSHSFHKSKFFNSANRISGGVYNISSSVSSYFDLGEQNKKLVEENRRLRGLLYNKKGESLFKMDTSNINYTLTSAKIIKNSYASPRNYLTIDKGRNDSIKQDMGVITSNGIIGIVDYTSSKYGKVQSILNTKSNINAKIKNTDYFGSLVWNTERYDVVQLIDIPRLVPLHVGDTIVTGAMSSIFPENIPIGTIRKYDLNASKTLYNIDVQLFNDMANLKNAYIIINTNRAEILELESKLENVQ